MAKIKILMADDDATLLEMYKERLSLEGFEVSTCHNGELALKKVESFKPDIILLDVMMPKLNGYETLKSLKSDPKTKDVTVIMVTALMRDADREKAIEFGAKEYLVKSEAMPKDIIKMIEKHLKKK